MAEQLSIAFLLFPNVTQLDLTGPAQVFAQLPGARIALVAKTRDPVPTDAGFALLPTATFAETPRVDIICIPGGFGINDAIDDAETLAWVQQVAAEARWVTSVCTGALLLGAAGLLVGYHATTHWTQHHYLAAFGAVPVQERVVIDRNRATGGGVTAGIDFALVLAARLAGDETAKLIELGLEYNPAPPFDTGSPDRAGPALVEACRARALRLAPDRGARTLAAAGRLGVLT